MWAGESIMEKNKKRAQRRKDNMRMLNRAKQMIRDWYRYDEQPDPTEIYEQARRRRDHMCVCSCSACGNPRRGDWSGRKERMTQPERKAEDAYYAQLEEYYMTVDPNDNNE